MTAQLLVLFVPMLAGAAFGRRIKSERFHFAVTDILFPCLVFSLVISGVPTISEIAVSAAALLLSLVILLPIGLLTARFFGDPKRACVLPIAFGNSGFLGIPATLIVAGDAAARYAVYFDQAMTIAIYSIGLSVIVPGGVRRGFIEVIKAPVFWIFLLALVLSKGGVRPPEVIVAVLDGVGRLTVPAALFAVGLDLDLSTATMKSAALPALVRIAGGVFAATITIAVGGWICAFAMVPDGVRSTLSDPSFSRMVLVQGLMPSAVFSALLPARYGQGGTLAPAIVLTTTAIFPLWISLMLVMFPAIAG